MLFYEKYLKYKTKYIALKQSINNNWIGGNEYLNVEFKICNVKINCSGDKFENPLKKIDFSNSKISIENINKLFDILKKYNICNLPAEKQTKIFCNIFKMIQSNSTYDDILKYIRHISISNKIGGDVSKRDETFLTKFKEDLIKQKDNIVYFANFEITEEILPIYKGDPEHMISRIRDVYKNPDLTGLNPLVNPSILSVVDSDIIILDEVTLELINSTLDSIIAQNKFVRDDTANNRCIHFNEEFNRKDIINFFFQKDIKKFLNEHPDYKKSEFFIEFKAKTKTVEGFEKNPENFRIFMHYNNWKKIIDNLWGNLVCKLLKNGDDSSNIVNKDIFYADICSSLTSNYANSSAYSNNFSIGIESTKDGPDNVVQLDLTKCYDSVKWPVLKFLLMGCFTRRFSKKYGPEKGLKLATHFVEIYMTLLTTMNISYNSIPIDLCTSLPTGPFSSASVFTWMMDELIYLWLDKNKSKYKLDEDFIIKIYIDDTFIKLKSAKAISNANEIVQSLWDFIQSFLLTVNLKKSVADPKLKLMIKETLQSNPKPLPPLEDTHMYLGIPFTRNIDKYFGVILDEFVDKKLNYKKFDTWFFIYNIVDNAEILSYLKWKLRPLFPSNQRRITINDIKSLIKKYLQTISVSVDTEEATKSIKYLLELELEKKIKEEKELTKRKLQNNFDLITKFYENTDFFTKKLLEGKEMNDKVIQKNLNEAYKYAINNNVYLYKNEDDGKIYRVCLIYTYSIEGDLGSLSHILCSNNLCHFVIMWRYKNVDAINNEKNIVCSLRANFKFDVAKLAEKYGGGGHANAAGGIFISEHPKIFFKLRKINQNI
jgi:hypothetical protein